MCVGTYQDEEQRACAWGGQPLKSSIVVGVLGALATGLAIGVQSTLGSRTGTLIGNARTGLLTNAIGGVIAGLLLLILVSRQGLASWRLPKAALFMLVASGSLGILIITGVAFSLQRTGVAAGLGTLIMGQLIISVIADSTGIGGVEAIPLTPQRVLGLFVMAAAVYLLLPKE
jgi:transporter family-2 protein